MVEFPGRNDGAGGAMFAEHTGIHLIDGVPKVDVGDIDRHFQDAAPVAARRLQDREHVLERLLGLVLDRADPVLPGSGVD